MDFSPAPETSGKSERRTYRFNPVEILIFATVLMVFLKSLFSLVGQPEPFKAAAMKPMKANPILSMSGSSSSDLETGRAPAQETSRNPSPNSSQNSVLMSIAFNCHLGDEESVQTAASKVRLVGSICTETLWNRASAGASPTRIRVFHAEKKLFSESFMNEASGKFTTDYIPLSPGTNTLQVEFTFPASAGAAQKPRLYSKTLSFQRTL